MVQGCYSIEKHRDRWSVLVLGKKVLICDSKKIALQVVRQANQALYLDGPMTRGRERGGACWSRRAHAKTPRKAVG